MESKYPAKYETFQRHGMDASLFGSEVTIQIHAEEEAIQSVDEVLTYTPLHTP